VGDGVIVALGSGVGVAVGGVPVTVGVLVTIGVRVMVGVALGMNAGPFKRKRAMVV
jgi:hypothetical protein